MVTAQLLGGAILRADDVPVTGPPAQRHRIALLTLVVAAWPAPVSRDRAMALLWPERDLPSARRLLNLALHVLRAALGDDVIVSATDGLVFDPSALRCDLHALRSAIQAHAADDVVRLYAGPLLEGFHLPDSAEFEHWLDERRAELAREQIAALRSIAERMERDGDRQGCVAICRKLVAADPHSSAHARMLIRALEAAGDRPAAIEHATEHAARLRADLDLPPDRDVAALAESLRRASAGPAPTAAAAAARATLPSVAVLPFVQLGADAGNDWFADGVTEDVIAHLSKIHALSVIARSSVMRFRRRDRPLREVSAALGARYVVDGSVRVAGDRARIVATLIDAEDDRQLWAETYDRRITDVFAIQTDVALHIAHALQARLTRDEQSRVRREPTRDVQAYRLFLQGRELFIRFTPASLREAIATFHRATERDPDFALAFAHVALAYVELAEAGALPPAIAYGDAERAARRAIQLDPELGAAHCTVAILKAARDFDWSGAEREFQRAIELSPSGAEAYDLYGRLCAGLGRYDEALALLRRAQELDPLAHAVDVVTALIRAGRYDEAIARGEETVEFASREPRPHATLGWAYFMAGRRAEGVGELERAVELAPGNALWLSQLGEALGLAGESRRATTILRELERRSASDYVSPYHLAYVLTGLGQQDRALDHLARAVAERTGPTYGIRSSFLFLPLHAHPRFHALLREMKLE